MVNIGDPRTNSAMLRVDYQMKSPEMGYTQFQEDDNLNGLYLQRSQVGACGDMLMIFEGISDGIYFQSISGYNVAVIVVAKKSNIRDKILVVGLMNLINDQGLQPNGHMVFHV